MTAYGYDSTRPWLIPDTAEYIMIYRNGLYAADRAQVQRQFPDATLYDIDVLGTDPGGCGIADVETGDMRPEDVPDWVDARLAAHPNGALCRIYSNLSTWPAVRLAVAKLSEGARAQVRYWVADPTGTPHFVPGSNATQYLWGLNWDESVLGREFIG